MVTHKQIYEALGSIKTDYSVQVEKAGQDIQKQRLRTLADICDIFAEDLEKRKPVIDSLKIPIHLTLKDLVDKVGGSKESVRNYINGIAVKTRSLLGTTTKLKYELLEY